MKHFYKNIIKVGLCTAILGMQMPLDAVAQHGRQKEIILPETQKKDQYRIDILLPINIDSIYPKGTLTNNPSAINAIQPYIHFYQGVKLAAKKLEHDKSPLDIYIHEEGISNWDLNHFNTTKGLNESDLIVALLSSKDLSNAATYAQQHKINFVSAFSPSDAGVNDNPYFHLLQPTLNSNIDELVKYSIERFPKEKKFIMFSDDEREKDLHDQIKSSLNNDKRVVSFDMSYTKLETQILSKVFDSEHTNVIYVPILNTQTSNKILEAISKLPDTYTFEIFGCPTWKMIQNEELVKHHNVSYYFTEAFNFDQNTGIVQDIKNNYNRFFHGVPSEMVYRGYELVIWYNDLLNKYGSIFNDKYEDATAAPFTAFKVKPVYNKENKFLYYENKNVSIYKVNAGIKELMNP